MSQDQNPASTRKPAPATTSKEAVLKQDNENLRLKINDREMEIKKLKGDNRQLQLKVENLERANAKNSHKLDQEKKIRANAVTEKEKFEAVMSKMKLAVASRVKMLGVDFDNIGDISEALDGAFNIINRLVTELQEKETLVTELQEEQAKLKSTVEQQKTRIAELEAEVAQQKEWLSNQDKQIEEQKKWIEDLKNANEKSISENIVLKQQVENLSSTSEKQKKESSNTFDDMTKKIFQMLELNVDKETRLREFEKRIKDLEFETSEQKNTLILRNKTIDELSKDLINRNNEVATLTSEVERLTLHSKELEAIVTVPKFEASIQTDISGAIEQQISDYPKLLKEIVALKHGITERSQHISNLDQENRELLAEIDSLLKKAARFYPCKTNHIGEISIMRAHPKRYLVATGATDLTCRLWRVDPESSGRKVVAIQRATVDGQLDTIAFSDDGKFLAAGTGYNNTGDGYLVFWCVDGSFQEGSVLHTIRSRPTVRFGRVKSMTFSPNSQFVYCGDATGKISCFNVEQERLVAVIQNHRDIIYDISVSKTNPHQMLYSVSHDQSLAQIELPSIVGGSADDNAAPITSAIINSKHKKNQPTITQNITEKNDRVTKDAAKDAKRRQLSSRLSITLEQFLADDKLNNVQQFQGTTLEKDARYPYWRVAVSANGKYLCCGSRKINIYMPSEQSLAELNEGPRVNDTDSDHVRTLRIFENYLLVSRVSSTKVKIFDLNDGKELKTFGLKKPVCQADFLCDNKHVIICQQETKLNELPQPCVMKIVVYSNNAKFIQSIPKEPTTPQGNEDDNDEISIQSEARLSPKQKEVLPIKFGNDAESKDEDANANVDADADADAKADANANANVDKEKEKNKDNDNDKEKGKEKEKEKNNSNDKEKEKNKDNEKEKEKGKNKTDDVKKNAAKEPQASTSKNEKNTKQNGAKNSKKTATDKSA